MRSQLGQNRVIFIPKQILFEGAVCQYSKSMRFRLNDGITSMSHAITLRVFGQFEIR